MARIRSVKPSLRTSRVVAQWKFEVRYFWVLLWGYLDDKGRGLDIPKAIAGDCYPLDDNITAAVIERWLRIIASTKIRPDRDPPLCRYEVAGTRYLHCVYWDDSQRPNRPSPSRLPPCPVHERLTEPTSEAGSERHSEGALSPQVLELGSRKLEFEQQQALHEPGGEPPPNAAAKIVINNTGATPAEAAAIVGRIRAEKRPRNLAGLLTAMARDNDLRQYLDDLRAVATSSAVTDAIDRARQLPPCSHGDPGGDQPHPTTGKPLCPLCRRERRAA